MILAKVRAAPGRAQNAIHIAANMIDRLPAKSDSATNAQAPALIDSGLKITDTISANAIAVAAMMPVWMARAAMCALSGGGDGSPDQQGPIGSEPGAHLVERRADNGERRGRGKEEVGAQGAGYPGEGEKAEQPSRCEHNNRAITR